MKILVTGAKGFIGKNLVAELKNRRHFEVLEYDKGENLLLLDTYTKKCDFVFHLAGVNRPEKEDDFMEGNFEFTSVLLDFLKRNNNKATVMLSSSIQAVLDTPYGKSKKAGEDLLYNYSKDTGAKVLIYRFSNVFGKWCKPNYNSAIATFCHNIARGLPINVNDESVVMNVVYIDDVINELIRALAGQETVKGDFCHIPINYSITLHEIVDLLYSFKNTRINLGVPNVADIFTKKLYSTYISYLPQNEFNTELKMNINDNGSFTEFIKTLDRGQVSVNISKPGSIKGNHWHHTKIEKFLVVSGKGIIRFRRIDSDEVVAYPVSGEKLEIIDIPNGYTHKIENVGNIDMVTIIWANELFDAKNPDTYYLEV